MQTLTRPAVIRGLSLLLLLAVVSLLDLGSARASGLPCNWRPTLAENVGQVDFVVLASLSDPSANDPKLFPGTGTTRMAILEVIKDHPKLPRDGKAVLNCYLPEAAKKPVRAIVLGDCMGRFEPGLIVPCHDTGAEEVAYLKTALKHGAVRSPEALAFYFQHLRNRNKFLADDAVHNFGRATTKELTAATKSYDRQALVNWLKSEDLAPHHMDLFARLLGLCGVKEDVVLLHDLQARHLKEPLLGHVGLMIGCCLLDRKSGHSRPLRPSRTKRRILGFAARGCRRCGSCSMTSPARIATPSSNPSVPVLLSPTLPIWSSKNSAGKRPGLMLGMSLPSTAGLALASLSSATPSSASPSGVLIQKLRRSWPSHAKRSRSW